METAEARRSTLAILLAFHWNGNNMFAGCRIWSLKVKSRYIFYTFVDMFLDDLLILPRQLMIFMVWQIPVNFKLMHLMPSVIWHRWLGIRKSIWPVKKLSDEVLAWYMSGASCKWYAYGPADVTGTPSSLASLKSRLVFTAWYLASAVYAIVMCLSVTSGCSTETAKHRITQTTPHDSPMEVPNALE